MHKIIEIERQDMFQQNGIDLKRLIKNSQIILLNYHAFKGQYGNGCVLAYSFWLLHTN